MSEIAKPEVVVYHTESPSEDEPMFVTQELTRFDADDSEAGGAIGKLLCFFFLYTVIAMSIVGWWTWSSVAAR
jgi:hypothetical protein